MTPSLRNAKNAKKMTPSLGNAKNAQMQKNDLRADKVAFFGVFQIGPASRA
jgi:hypothetical protein